jgi:hypothetical protein
VDVTSNLLIVAFDGADHDLIQRFGCENLQQVEFGRIDNHSHVNNVVTSELFASFLTGKPTDVHGIEGLRRWPDTRRGRLMERMSFLPAPAHNGFRRLLDAQQRTYYCADLEHETFLDAVENTRSINFPAYDKQTLHDRIWTGLSLYDDLDLTDTDSRAEYFYRRRELLRHLQYAFDVLACHFIRLDTIQHIHEESAWDDPSILKPYYAMIDALAGEIRAEADEYDYVLFMSDHGRPEGKEHNHNAFYSVNEPLNLGQPSLVEFHDLVLELLEADPPAD